MNVVYEGILQNIKDRLTEGRDAGDTHDYSSSSYNGFDDGYMNGVYDTVHAVREAFEAELS